MLVVYNTYYNFTHLSELGCTQMYTSLGVLLGGLLFLSVGFAYESKNPESAGTPSLFYGMGAFFLVLGYLSFS